MQLFKFISSDILYDLAYTCHAYESRINGNFMLNIIISVNIDYHDYLDVKYSNWNNSMRDTKINHLMVALNCQMIVSSIPYLMDAHNVDIQT